MPNGMEHVDWGHHASGRVHDLQEQFKEHCRLEKEWIKLIMGKMEHIEERLKILEDTLNARHQS